MIFSVTLLSDSMQVLFINTEDDSSYIIPYNHLRAHLCVLDDDKYKKFFRVLCDSYPVLVSLDDARVFVMASQPRDLLVENISAVINDPSYGMSPEIAMHNRVVDASDALVRDYQEII